MGVNRNEPQGFIEKWANLFNSVAIVALGVMLLLTVVDILSSKFLRKPILGGMDINGLLLLIVSAFAVSYVQVNRRHIVADFVLQRMPRQVRFVLNIISSFLTLIVSGLLIVTSIMNGIGLQHTKDSSMTLLIPLFPFAYAIALACVPLLLVLLKDFLKSLRRRSV